MKFNRAIVLTFTLISSILILQGQNLDLNIKWNKNLEVEIDPEINAHQLLKPLWFNGAREHIAGEYILPIWYAKVPLQNREITSLNLSNISSESVDYQELNKDIGSNYSLKYHLGTESGKQYAYIEVTPLRKKNGVIEILTSATVQVKTDASRPSSNFKKKKDQTYNSVLSSGSFYKLQIPETGVYEVNASFLASNGLGSDVAFSSINIYGNGGVMLPEIIADERPEDLLQIPVHIIDDNQDGILNGADKLIWYTVGPTSIEYQDQYDLNSHDFDQFAYNFITVDGTNSKLMSQNSPNLSLSAEHIIETYDHIIYREQNEENLIKSGRQWWGDNMQNDPIKEFSYNIPDIVPKEDVDFKLVTGVRSLSSTSLAVKVDENSPFNIYHGSVSGKYDDPFISGSKTTNSSVKILSPDIQIKITFNKTSLESAAWLDYFILSPERKLKANYPQEHIRIHNKAVSGNLKFSFDKLPQEYILFDVSDPHNARLQQFAGATKSEFVVSGTVEDALPEYFLFDITKTNTPAVVGKVENQNLHGIEHTDYIIITSIDLLDEAERLAQFHRDHNNYKVDVVTDEQVYNEFSSGGQDVTGIRDFVKLIYDRGNTLAKPLKYLLLFGDASYDYKDIEKNNTNVVATYQSYNSYDPPYSYCSDDYYAILDDNEGFWGISSRDESLDIGVGRLPASNIEEAKIIVDKILHYHTETSIGDWTQTLTFVADDEDANSHVGPSETMTQIIGSQYPNYNINKIWMDAYEQVSFGSGNKYPKVNEDINKAIDSKGTLIFNYVGHGGENGMAHERVVTRSEINSWSNYDKLSFYITASCELAKIDNLELESPGELMLFNPNGGAIGLVATTRVVYIGANTDLNFEIINNNMFEVIDNKLQPLGDTYKNTRNAAFEEINKRCFMLLADPAMSLHHPQFNAVTTKINGIEIGLFNDTLSALSLVTIEGEIRDRDNKLYSNYNGTLYPTFFDKPSTYKTLANDEGSIPIQFNMQDRVIYKGQVSITNGKFSFQFVIPKDIAYNIGSGKLSYFGKDGISDAGGAEYKYNIGGTSEGIVADKTPPAVKLFIDDESWSFGGTTNTTPDLLATIFDQSGINTIGSGIGREMEAILDEGTEQETSIILNDFYTPELNSYQSGKIKYAFNDLSPGTHTLRLKVWDVYNNSAEDYTEFVVAEDENITVSNLLNHPNPFSTFTTFHFDHNKAGQSLNVVLNISSIAGNVVKSLSKEIVSASAHSSEINWDGLDNYGDKLARGVYLYTLKFTAEDGSSLTKTEKLYITN